jgi:hypothetical protein
MAAHEHRLFRVRDGKIAGQIEEAADFCELDEDEWPLDPDEWGQTQSRWIDYVDDSGEFAACADGWYWQWRRVRAFEETGTTFGPLNGPFTGEAEARAHEANPANAHLGMGRLFEDGVCGIATAGPFSFDEEEGAHPFELRE